MANSIARIATHLLTGVTIGVTLGAMCLSTMPIWLGLLVILAVCIADILHYTQGK